MILFSARLSTGDVEFSNRHILVLICLSLAACAQKPAPTVQSASVYDIAAIPYLTDEGRREYAEFRLAGLHRAFAIAPDGTWGVTWQLDSPTQATSGALRACEQQANAPCRLYAVNACVVWENDDCLGAMGDVDAGVAAYGRGDYARAFAEMWEPALKGDPTAQYYIGQAYITANGARYSGQRALEWFERSAQGGNADALYEAGLIYLRGSEGQAAIPKDRRKARELIQEAAERGSALAAFQMGEWHRFGIDGPRDEAEARRWYRLAADAGYKPAAESGWHGIPVGAEQSPPLEPPTQSPLTGK